MAFICQKPHNSIRVILQLRRKDPNTRNSNVQKLLAFAMINTSFHDEKLQNFEHRASAIGKYLIRSTVVWEVIR